MTDNPIITAIGLLTLLTLLLLCAGLGWLAGRDELSSIGLDDLKIVDDAGSKPREYRPWDAFWFEMVLATGTGIPARVDVTWSAGQRRNDVGHAVRKATHTLCGAQGSS